MGLPPRAQRVVLLEVVGDGRKLAPRAPPMSSVIMQFCNLQYHEL